MMTRATATLLIVAVALVASGIAWSAQRVAELERHEFEHEGKAQSLTDARRSKGSTAVSARLDRVDLRADDNAFFEVCSADGMPEKQWLGSLDFVVFQLEPLKLLLRVPLDKEHLEVVRRNSRGACLTLGGGPLTVGGAHAVDAVWPGKPFPEALAQASIRVRVLARHPLTPADRVPVLLIALGALLLLVTLYLARIPHVAVQAATLLRTSVALVGGLAVLVGGWFASAYLGPFGPTWGLLKTVALGAAEVAAAIGFSHFALRTSQPVASLSLSPSTRAALSLSPSTRAALSLVRSTRAPWLALASAPLFGLLLMFTASFALRLVPSTGESAIETFISWPSGMLAFGTIGVLVPVCEEFFFRGFVYGLALRFGKVAAFALTVVSFVAIHAAQTWGNWGSLLSITFTGLVLTALRAGTGSTLIPAIAHLVYNLGLTLRSL